MLPESLLSAEAAPKPDEDRIVIPGDLSRRSPETIVGAKAEGEPWYAIWTRSRAEKAVADQLERKKIEVFLPTIQRWSRWKDRKKQIDWPLFPGYCFARFDPRVALDVRICVGVATILTFEGKLAPIPHDEIAAIQRVVSSDLAFDPCPLLHEGDIVEVIHGPLTGVVGRLISKGLKATLVVAITMINRGVEVRLDAADVRKY